MDPLKRPKMKKGSLMNSKFCSTSFQSSLVKNKYDSHLLNIYNKKFHQNQDIEKSA